MSATFPRYQQPTLAQWLPGHRAAAIRDAVAKAIECENPELAIGALSAELEVERISLGARYFDDKPWTRRMTAGDRPDTSLVRQGIYPGQTYAVDYTVYRLDVTSGAEMVAVGASGGPALDPTFVRLEHSAIVVRAADDRHRDQLMAAIEEHVDRANEVIDEWNNAGLHQAVRKELQSQLRLRARQDDRREALEAAGFLPTPDPQSQRAPLPDTRRHAKQQPRSTGPEDAVSWRLEADQFAAIIECMARHRDLVETHPGAGARPEAQEEDHRDSLLHALNMRFRDGTAESFSRKGKTDVRLLVGDQSVFHAECKIWRGVSTVEEAFGQLVDRYLTYRDRCGALVFFVRDIARPDALPKKVIDRLVEHQCGERLNDVHGIPVVQVRPTDRPPVALAVVMIVVDSAAPRR